MENPNDQREANARIALQYLPPPPPPPIAGPIIGGTICGIIATSLSGCLALGFALGHPAPSTRHLPGLPFWFYLAALVGAMVMVGLPLLLDVMICGSK